MPSRPSAREIIDLLVDPGSLEALPGHRTSTDEPGYAAELEQARAATGLDEAVLTATARLDGREVVLIAGEFGFLGGSIGVATSDQVLAAIDLATERRLPVLALPSSGGTRMQEGTLAFVQMVKIGQAVLAHRAAGLPYLVHLRHPTTGGVMASWASLGQVTTGQPGALVGFLGPRVQEALVGQRIREGVQRTEHLAEVGVIDAVVPDGELREVWSTVLRTLLDGQAATSRSLQDVNGVRPAAGSGRATIAGATGLPSKNANALVEENLDNRPVAPATVHRSHDAGTDAWRAVLASREPGRPGIVQLLATATQDLVHLSGTGDGEVDPAVEMGLARIAGQPCVVIGTCREKQRARQLGPEALRMAQRAIALGGELGLPVVTVIDTPGAALTEQAESDALSGEIARTLAALLANRTPVLSVLMGQGSGGAALALMPSDACVVAQNGWLAPLPPEGSSAITFRDADHADQMARAQGIAAPDLLRAGIVDQVVPEPSSWGGGNDEDFCRALARAVAGQLAALREVPEQERLARRVQRFRQLR